MPNFKQMPMTPAQAIRLVRVFMFPMSVEEAIPRDCDVRIVGDAMDLLDWSSFEAGYSETRTSRMAGCPPYPPKVLAKILVRAVWLVYGYSKGIRSSRVLEDAAKNDKRYIWLAGGLDLVRAVWPDHTTIARFRRQKQAELKAAYKGSVRICAEAGVVLLNVTSTDGTKMKAKASKRSLYDAKRIAKEMEAIERILAEAEEVDRREDELYGSGTGNEVPKELADAKKRREKLEEIAKRLKEAGCNKISSTDEECRVMKTGDGLRPGYNVQFTVDSANQVIVAADVTNAQTDNGQLAGQLEQVVENTGMKPDVVLADAGYSDQETLANLSSMKQEAIIPPIRKPQEEKRSVSGQVLHQRRRARCTDLSRTSRMACGERASLLS